jgi:hypothetical protein
LPVPSRATGTTPSLHADRGVPEYRNPDGQPAPFVEMLELGDGARRMIRVSWRRQSTGVNSELIKAANAASGKIAEQTILDGSVGGFEPNEWRRFVRQLVPAALLVLAWFILCFVIVNVVDPYGVTGWPVINGFNTVKPLQSLNARIYKPFAFLRGDYNGLVLGGSQELRGIEPQTTLLHDAGYRLYNFASVEQRPYEAEEIAEYAVGRGEISTIIIGLQFTRYNLDPLSIGDLRPYYPKGSILRWALTQYFRASISPLGIEDSYDTVVASRDGQQILAHTREGREKFVGPRDGVQYDYEGQFARVLARYLNVVLPRIAPQAAAWLSGGFDHSALRKLIELARMHKIRLVAFIPPDHALEMEALRRKGLWPVFERWKRELVCEFYNAAATQPYPDIVLWDFSGYNSITTQAVPRSTAQGAVMGYWDPIHYATSTGDKILPTVLRLNDDAHDGVDFGVELTTSNIESHLAQLRAAQASYEASHPDDLKWLASLDHSASPAASEPPRQEDIHCSIDQ